MGLYHTTDLEGISELNPDRSRLREILTSLDSAEAKEVSHPDVALINDDNGWSITVYASGVITLEQLDQPDEPPRFMKRVNHDKALRLWLDLAAGKIDSLRALKWQKTPAS